MKLRLEIDGDVFDVEVERTVEGLVATCEGTTFPVRLLERAPSPLLDVEGTPSRVEVTSDDRAVVDGTALSFRLLSYEPGGGASNAGANGGTPVNAVMPGRLVRVLVQAGQSVEKGQPLFVLEAMKMQNELGSPVTGLVAELLAKEGDVVESGRRLARIEAHAPRKA